MALVNLQPTIGTFFIAAITDVGCVKLTSLPFLCVTERVVRLLGILTLQSFRYFLNFPDDHILVKFVVRPLSMFSLSQLKIVTRWLLFGKMRQFLHQGSAFQPFMLGSWNSSSRPLLSTARMIPRSSTGETLPVYKTLTGEFLQLYYFVTILNFNRSLKVCCIKILGSFFIAHNSEDNHDFYSANCVPIAAD